MRKRMREEQKINEDTKKNGTTHTTEFFWIVTEMGRGREKESKGSDRHRERKERVET